MTTAASDAAPRQTAWSERSLHLCVFCAFAISEPLFSALAKQFVYLHDLGAGWIEVGYLLLVLTCVVPAGVILLDRLLVLQSARWGGRGRNLGLAVMIWLVWLSILRPILQIEFLAMQAMVWLVTAVLATLGAYLSLQLYLQSLWFRRWISAATVGLVFFPVSFAYQYGSLRSRVQEAPPLPISHPVPVIFVVFDEFSGTTLMNHDLQIDNKNFPNFARLARTSTWYRQASTVHDRTDVAVPALLSGRYPVAARAALESEYPGNLFRVIHATGAYDMTVYEPVTRLCPVALQNRRRATRSTLQKIGLLTWTMATVYPRLIFPADTPIDFPPISLMWFGLPEHPEKDPAAQTGLCRTSPFAGREDQLESFLASLRPTDKPLFNFLHVEFPHLPWCFLPSGRAYNFDQFNAFLPSGAWGEIGEDWGPDAAIVARNEHRYLQQVRYVDQFLGRLLDRLGELDLLDRCLLVVTADHGVSFRPGHSRRIPDAENIADLLSIPLFVKLPAQSSGETSDRNVESVDILPTLAHVLGVELPEAVDGACLATEPARPRKTAYFKNEMTVLEPAIPRLQAAVDRRLAIFGSDSLDHPPRTVSSHSDWHGRSIGEFVIEDKPLSSLVIDPNVVDYQHGRAEFLPCLVAGSLNPSEISGSQVDLVLAVNDVICDSGTTFPKGRTRGFEFLIPESSALQRPCKIGLFAVMPAAEGPRRLRCLKSWDLREQP